jgi:hypothetical protein
MTEFTPPRSRRARQRVENTRAVIGGFEHEQSLRVHMNAQDAIHGIGEEWHEAREDLHDFQAQYGRQVLERTDLGQMDFNAHTGEQDGTL